MTSDDGAGSSGRIIEDQYITAPISAGGDGITVYGSDGPVVIIRRCVIRNWGIGSRFTVRSFGAWAHDGASIRAEDCVFWQDGFWQFGLRGFVVDLANWIGWCFNRRDWNPLHWLLPGVCRGLTASQKGKVSASRCWTNRWWIRLQGHRGPRMSKREALALMAELEGRLL
ncbi:hypothetical protein [Desulfovibrio piger]|uniref:hypothetical protein n=1 Tax=Desulfovibrio piger TaxID=901 RepID=UPI0026EE640E|nr:hypothetical protein [Desulfovibrio piger]